MSAKTSMLTDSNNTPQIIQELGNMFLVNVDGATKQVAHTPKNELLYKHGLYDLLNGHGENNRTELSTDGDETYVAIAPTEHDDIYSLWFGEEDDVPLQTPPSRADNVLRGVRDALSEYSSLERIREEYQWVLKNNIRREVVEPLITMFPQSSVVPSPEGWHIEGLFVVTWDARVFLLKNESEEGSFKVRGSETVKTDSCEFISLTPQFDVEELIQSRKNTVTIDGTTHELGELELIFLSKVSWLINYRDNYSDDVFWDVIHNSIERGRY